MTWEANGWKPIETAPKDGTGVIVGWFVTNGDWHYRLAHWGGRGWMTTSSMGIVVCFPRYWQPLPIPPRRIDDER